MMKKRNYGGYERRRARTCQPPGGAARNEQRQELGNVGYAGRKLFQA